MVKTRKIPKDELIKRTIRDLGLTTPAGQSSYTEEERMIMRAEIAKYISQLVKKRKMVRFCANRNTDQ